MKLAVWRDMSYLCGSAVFILCLLQVPGWLFVPPELSGQFVLTMMASQAAAYLLTLPIGQSSAPVWAYGLCETAATEILGTWLCAWWVPLGPSIQVSLAIAAAAVGAFLVSMLLRRMELDAIASSINEQIAKNQADAAPGRPKPGRREAKEDGSGDHTH